MSLTIEEAFYQRTAGYAGIAALIETRLYPGDVPQEVVLPAVSYKRIDYEQWLTHSGPSGLARVIIQATIAAYDYSDLKAITEQLRLCWSAWTGLIGTVFRVALARVENVQDTDVAQIENALGLAVDIVIIYYET